METANQPVLSTIFTSSEAGETIFKHLSHRRRYRDVSDITQMYTKLPSPKFSYEEFLTAWQTLANAGVGSVIIGRGNKPDRFAWNYNLKEVATVAANKQGLDLLSPLTKKRKKKARRKGKRGRKPGSKNKPKIFAKGATPDSDNVVLHNVTIFIPRKDMEALTSI